jgi:hypothetical protein
MSVTQFVKAALIGTDGAYVVLSPVVEGVDGASRTIFVTEAGEEIKVEDDQTVLTSVKNTITIIATVLDADVAKINSWLTNDISVGFSGYTIGGLGYAVACTSDDTTPAFQLELRANSTDNGTAIANRNDAFTISAIQRVSEIKHTWRIVLSQICLQGKNAVNGIRYGAQPSSNLLETTVDKNFTTMATSSTLPMYGYLEQAVGTGTVVASGSAYKLTLASASEASLKNVMFFPFGNVTLSLDASGTQTASFNQSTNAIVLGAISSGGTYSILASGNLSTGASSTSVSSTVPTGTVFIDIRTVGNTTAASGQNIYFSDLKLRPNI